MQSEYGTQFLDQAARAFNAAISELNGTPIEDVSGEDQLQLLMALGQFTLANYQSTRALWEAGMQNGHSGHNGGNGKAPKAVKQETNSNGKMPTVSVEGGRVGLWRWRWTPDEAREVARLLIAAADRLDNK